MNKQILTINEAATLLGVSIKTLRRWDQKGLLSPQRTIGNQRRYNLEDIEGLKGKKIKTVINKIKTTDNRQVTINEAADLLGISPKTLHRWEQKGKLVSQKTSLNKKVYLLSQLEMLKEGKPEAPLQIQTVRPPIKIDLPEIKDEVQVMPQKKSSYPSYLRPLFAGMVIASLISIVGLVNTGSYKAMNNLHLEKLAAFLPHYSSTKSIKTSNDSVLAAATQKRDFALKINVPVEFMSTASVAGTLTAPNILYSITPGQNITVSGDPQNPTISASGGVTSLQGQSGAVALTAGSGISISGLTISSTGTNSFENIKVGSSTITAGSSTDTLEFVAGSGISLSSDTTNKKLTINSSSTGTALSGLTTNGVLYADSSTTAVSLTPGTSGYILQSNGSGSPPSWVLNSATGNVIGPASSTDTALVRFSGATGKIIQNSGVLLDASNNLTGVNSLSVLPATDITGLTLTGTNVASSKLAYFNAKNSSGTIFDISYGASQTLTGALVGQAIDLNNGSLTATNQNVTGQKITLPTITNTNAAGTENLLGLQVTFGSGAGINQNGAGSTIFSDLDVTLPALTQTSGSLTANGLAVTTSSSITTGGVANGLLISPTGVGAGTLNGVNVATISAAGAGNETALNVGSGWDAVLRVNGTPVINGQGVTLPTGGGTGIASYTTGDILYASATNTLSALAGGVANNGKALTISGGVPTWGVISGSSCTDCVLNDPTSSTTNTIAPTGQTTTGLIVKQTSTASPTNDIFRVTDSTGSTVYFSIDKNGNVNPSNTIGNTLTLTPTTDTTALTLVGTNVPTASLQYINAKNTSGTIFNLAYGAAQTLSTSLATTGMAVDLSTNVTATNANVTAQALTLPAETNTITSGTKSIKGVSVSGGGLNQNGAGGTTTFAAFDATIPALTQTAGTLNAYGVNVTTPTSITTGGTAAALNVSASGVGAGSLFGLNISAITGGAGTETAINVGSGWDSVLKVNGTTIIDGSGNFNIATSTGILPVANGGSPFEQNLGAIFPRIITQDLLMGGISSPSASFHVYGAAGLQGTNPVASIAANTSFAGLVVDNKGSGDLFAASSSGLTRFTVTQNGDVQLGNYTTSPNLILAGADTITNGETLTWAENPARYIRARYDSNANRLIFENDSGNPILAMGRNNSNSVGIGTTTFAATLDVRGNATNGGTIPIASLSAKTSYAGLVVDNWGSGDLFTASSSGTNRFVITQSGNVGIGTTNPTGKLHVVNGFAYIDDAAFGGTPLITLAVGDTDTGLDSTGDGLLDVYSNNVVAMRIRNGVVAVGTTTDSNAALTVAGAGSGTMKVTGECGGNYTGISLNGITGGACGTGYNILSSTTDQNLYLNRPSGSEMHFRQNNTDEMQINSSGNVGIGTTPSYRLDARNSTASYIANIQNNTSTGQGLRIQIRTTGTPGNFVLFQSLSGASDFTNGTITGNGGGGTTYNTSSDQRLKENIVDTHYTINDLMKVHVTDFNFINYPNSQTNGYIAQQLYEIYPPAVHVGGDNPITDPWSVDYGRLTPLIIKGVQDQQGEIEGLKQQVSNMLAGSQPFTTVTTQALSLGGTDLNTKLLGLDNIASESASLISPFAGLESQVLSLSDRVASLEAKLSASDSAMLNFNLAGFSASSGAELNLDKLDVSGSIISDRLSVISYATVNDLSVNGTFTAGLLQIKGLDNGGSSISTLNGDLKLQNQGYGGIDILDGKITIDTQGNIIANSEITAKKFNVDTTDTLSASVGQATLPLGATSVIVNTGAVTSNSKIFVTPKTKTSLPLSVTTQAAGTSFKVELTSPAPQAIKFDWWVIN